MPGKVNFYGKFRENYVTRWLQPMITFFDARDYHGDVDFAAFGSQEEVDRRLASYQEKFAGVVGLLSCRLCHRSAEDILIMDVPGQPVHLYDAERNELGRVVGSWE
jgi:hypothetical protein